MRRTEYTPNNPIPMPIEPLTKPCIFIKSYHAFRHHGARVSWLARLRVTTRPRTYSNPTNVWVRAGYRPRPWRPALRSRKWLRGIAHNGCGRPAQGLLSACEAPSCGKHLVYRLDGSLSLVDQIYPMWDGELLKAWR